MEAKSALLSNKNQDNAKKGLDVSLPAVDAVQQDMRENYQKFKDEVETTLKQLNEKLATFLVNVPKDKGGRRGEEPAGPEAKRPRVEGERAEGAAGASQAEDAAMEPIDPAEVPVPEKPETGNEGTKRHMAEVMASVGEELEENQGKASGSVGATGEGRPRPSS